MAIAISLSLTCPTLAEETPKAGESQKMGAITVQATKIEKDISQVTDAVTIVDEAAISQSGLTDFTDLLRYTPGIEFKRAGGPGQPSYPNVRGFAVGHFLVVIDGIKVNSARMAGTNSLFSNLDPYLIEKVEVLRGPQAALYGSDTTAGVIAITTKAGLPGTNFNVGAQYGTYEWKKGYTGLRGSEGAFKYSLNIAYTDSEGVHEHEDFQNFTPQVKLSYDWGDTFSIEASYMYIKADWNMAMLKESYDFNSTREEWWAFQMPDPDNWNKDERNLASLKLKHQIFDNLRQKLTLGYYSQESESNNPNNGLLGYVTAPQDNFTVDYANYYNKGDSVPVYDDGTGVPYHSKSVNYSADYNLIWDADLGLGINTLLLGLTYLDQEGKKWGRSGDDEGSMYMYSVYLSDQLLLLNEALVLSGGLRIDDHEEFGTKATYKFGASYAFKDIGSTLFANYGTSFRAPSLFNLYDPRYGNKDLDPESGWTVEGGLRQTLLNNKLYFEITLWHTKLDDAIAYVTVVDPDGSLGGTYANRDTQTTQGVEFAFRWDFYKNLALYGNYTYCDSKTEEEGVESRSTLVSRNKGLIGVQYSLTDKLFLDLSAYYSGPRLRWRGDVEMNEYWRVDAAARYTIWDGLKAFARVNNLFDEDIEEGLGYEQPGIYIIAGLEWDFAMPGTR
jgi:outer membrane cobalamin receptor